MATKADSSNVAELPIPWEIEAHALLMKAARLAKKGDIKHVMIVAMDHDDQLVFLTDNSATNERCAWLLEAAKLTTVNSLISCAMTSLEEEDEDGDGQ